MTISPIADELERTVDAAALHLRSLDRHGVRPRPDAWSPREIIGHLIDSAANNHQRFVRVQEAAAQSLPGYAQEHWVSVQRYQEAPWPELVELWRLYNRHLARVIRFIPETALERQVTVGAPPPVTLGFLVRDYLDHLKKHLGQIDAM